MFLSYKNSICLFALVVSLGSSFFGRNQLFTAAQPYVYVEDINATYVGKTVKSVSENNPVDVDEFLGIKFATQERFERSEVLLDPLEDDDETADYVVESDDGLLINATMPGPICAQPASNLAEGQNFSEDCLYLNIYRPSNYSIEDEGPLPVIVWIHGGAFNLDADPWNFTTLAGNKNVIVVDIKYRLSIFGFLPQDIDGTGGMNGILDMVEALKWIQQRIASFGGDPESITLLGQSAGSISTCFLSVMEGAKDLYQRSIMESIYCIVEGYSYRNAKDGYNKTNEILQNMECSSPPCGINDLKNLPTEELMKGNFTFQFATNDDAVFPVPLIELFKTKGKIIPHDIIIGGTTFDQTITIAPGSENFSSSDIWDYTGTEDVSEEIKDGVLAAYSPDLPMYNGSTFAANSQAVGDINSVCFMREQAAIAASSIDGNVYSYLLGYLYPFDAYVLNGYQNVTRKNDPNFDDSHWSSHSADLPLVFGNGGTTFPLGGQDAQLSDKIMSLWANFARSGDPNPQVPPSSAEPLFTQWTPVSNDTGATNNTEASDPRYLYITGDGGSMIESNKVKTGQCAAVLPTNQYFRTEDSELDVSIPEDKGEIETSVDPDDSASESIPEGEGEIEVPVDPNDSATPDSAGFRSEFRVAALVVAIVASLCF